MKIRISIAADTGWFQVRPTKDGARTYRISPVLYLWCRRQGANYYVFYPSQHGPYIPSVNESDMKKYFESIRRHGKAILATPEQIKDIEYNLDWYLSK